jgi:hypothetical protein
MSRMMIRIRRMTPPPMYISDLLSGFAKRTTRTYPVSAR